MTEKIVKYDPNKYNDDELAVQSNDILFGQQSFSNLQRRIYLLAVAQIKRSDTQLKPYRVYIKDLMEYGISDNIYSHMDRVTDGLMRKVFKRRFIKNGKRGWEKWPMISWAEHIEGQGYIEVEIHSKMEELLLDLKEKGNFTPVPIVNALSCSSTYGSRIYELIYSWRRYNKMEISVSELRAILKLENQYKNFSHFRRYVLKKAQKDLQKHTNMRFAWKEEKRARGRGKGRKITHLVFEFHFIAGQMDMALEEPKKGEIKLKFNLVKRLKNNAEFNSKKIDVVIKWLKNNPEQQKLLSDWLHHNVECESPADSMDKPIRDMQAWAWPKVNDRIQNGGFPNSGKTNKSDKELKPDIQPDQPTNNSNNPFKKMLSSLKKSE